MHTSEEIEDLLFVPVVREHRDVEFIASGRRRSTPAAGTILVVRRSSRVACRRTTLAGLHFVQFGVDVHLADRWVAWCGTLAAGLRLGLYSGSGLLALWCSCLSLLNLLVRSRGGARSSRRRRGWRDSRRNRSSGSNVGPRTRP